MDVLIKMKLATIILLMFVSCQARAFQEDKPVWEGVFDLSPRGEQKARAQFDLEKQTGILMLPDLIPIPLNLSKVRQKDDSLFFTVRFRSGPAYCKAVKSADRIEGIMEKSGLPTAKFWMKISDKPLDEPVIKPPKDEPLIVETRSDLESEKLMKQRLEALWNKYDLEPYVYTKKVKIQQGVIPHSHPILALSTNLDTETELLSTFLHEQMHWYSLTDHKGFEAAAKELLKKYPKVPSELPEGAGSEQSTFLHLGICYLEFHTLAKVIGKEAAKDHFNYKTTQYYRWVYRTILKDLDFFEKLFEDNGLHFD